MDIDAQNAQFGNVNDEQKQQILAQRNILGGIIKKGNPLHKNIINVIILLVLLPYMIFMLCYKGGKKLIKYTFRSLKFFIKWSKEQIELITYWTIDKSIKCYHAFIEGTIKGYYLFLTFMDKVISRTKKIIEIVIIKPIQFLSLKLCDWAFVAQQYAIYYWIVTKNRILKPLKIQARLFLGWLNIQVTRLSKIIYQYGKIKMQQCGQILSICLRFLLEKAAIFLKFIFRKSILLGKKIFIIALISYGKIELWSLKATYYTYEQLKTLSYFLIIKISTISKFIYFKTTSLSKQLWAQLIKFYTITTQKTFDISIFIIDYITKEYLLFKSNIASPIAEKIKFIQRLVYQKVLAFCIYVTEHLRAAFLFIKLTIIPYLKHILWNYWVLGKNDTWLVYSYISERVKKVYNCLKNFFEKCKQLIVFCSKFLKAKLKKFGQKSKQLFKFIFTQIKKYTKIIIEAIIKIYQKSKQFIILTGRFIAREGNRTQKILKQIMKKISDLIQLLLEKFCKLTIRFFVPVLQTFILIDKIISYGSCVLFAVLHFPIRIRDKIIDVSLDYIYIKFPAQIFRIALFFWRTSVKIFELTCYTVNLIKKQTKKIARIIHNKLIIPIIEFIKAVYNFIKRTILFCKEKVINFKDMLKYDYILPAWAVIRLFAVAQKTRIHNFLIISKEAWVELLIRMKHNREQRMIRIRQFIAVVKNQIREVKQQLTEPIRQLILYLKAQFIRLKNYIMETAQKVKLIVLDVYNSVKQAIFGIFNIVKEQMLEVVQFLKQQIIQFQAYVKGVMTQIAQSIRESLKEVISLIKQQVIQIKNSCQQQLAILSVYCNEVANSIKASIQQTQDSLKNQIAQSRQAFLIYKDEITNSIAQIWSSIVKRFV